MAGREKRSQEQVAETEERFRQHMGKNLLSGFELELLAEALGVDKQVVRRVQGQDDNRGEIVRVEKGLQVLQPSRRSAEQETQEQEREEREQAQESRECPYQSNGLEEAYCTLKNKQNIGNPMRADYYNPRAGRLTTLNSQKLPILRFIQLSAEKGVLRRVHTILIIQYLSEIEERHNVTNFVSLLQSYRTPSMHLIGSSMLIASSMR